jgi:hypothetical protein
VLDSLPRQYLQVCSFSRALVAFCVWSICSILALGAATLRAEDEPYERPTRANDLLYGESLFEYYQGRSFEALTILNVAKEQGGIEGHGDHPLLVEGGLMLAYGMTREAQAHFEKLLSGELKAHVSSEARNQAWFYLGKVFYLEEDFAAAEQALGTVDSEQLLKDDESLYLEWRYLLAQLALKEGSIIEASTIDLELSSERNDLWAVYVLYNQALSEHQAGEPLELVTLGLQQALGLLESIAQEHNTDANSESGNEQKALRDRIQLSLGQLFLEAQQYAQSVQHLKQISYDSLVSDEALFQYAVAQSHLGNHRLALGALNRLNERSLFTPWLQQVPYALAFLHEQLDGTGLAAQSYKAAGDHYDKVLLNLDAQQKALSEESLLAAMEIPFAVQGNDDANGNDYNDDYFSTSRPVLLGESTAKNDAYGRLAVRPSDFYIVNLLATEPFQIALRDLHELYKLQNSLALWKQSVQAFEFMLETRKEQRQNKLANVSQHLETQNADQWKKQYETYNQAITKALSEEDLEFFMDEEQLEFAQQIRDAKQTLELLPDDEDKREYVEKFERIERFYDWWLADRYGVNRWAAQRELGQLESAMDEFETRRLYLQRELENERFQEDLDNRVAEAALQIDGLRTQIDAALGVARKKLMAKVIQEFERQKVEVARYQLSARHAQARLTDRLYRESTNTAIPIDQIVVPMDPNTAPSAAKAKASAKQQGGEP